MPIDVSVLIKQLENKYNLIYSIENEKILKEEINVLISKTEKIKYDIMNKVANDFSEWEENVDCLKSILDQLKMQQKLSLNETSKDNIENFISSLNEIYSVCEIIFPSKKVGLEDWNKNKQDLFKTLELLEEHKDKELEQEEMTNILKLCKIPTSEDGLYKQFAVGIDNKKHQTFTDIFYLLKTREISFFHQLDVDETWTWLGGEPLTIFKIEDNKLTEQTLNQSTYVISIPHKTWFAAKIIEKVQQSSSDEKESISKEDDLFTLISCQCIPAFTMNCFHNGIDKSLVHLYRHATPEDRNTINKLLTPEQKIELNEQFSTELDAKLINLL